MKRELPKVFEHPFSKNTPIGDDFLGWVYRLIDIYDTQENAERFKSRITALESALAERDRAIVVPDDVMAAASKIIERIGMHGRYGNAATVAYFILSLKQPLTPATVPGGEVG